MSALKIALFVPFILLLIFLERRIPFRKLPIFRQGFFSDLGWYPILQNQLLNFCLIGYLYALPPTYHFNIITGQPLVVQFIITFILFDFATYWLHRFIHNSHLMWRFHELHHSSTEIDWLSGLRNHAVDTILAALVNVVIFCGLGGDFKIVGIIFTVVTVHGIYKHSNIKHKTGWIQYLIISAEMHRAHHLIEMKYQKSNYGTVLSIWDWMFKTAYYPRESDYKDMPYGTDDHFPQNFIKGNIYVFRKQK